uniref:TNFR-Cys domain-containing protein n=1 Tax=Pelusios castaneus TaxID=367368 RepID=A0A8C8SGT5_9SAUR
VDLSSAQGPLPVPPKPQPSLPQPLSSPIQVYIGANCLFALGSRVFKVCTQLTSTTCKPCVGDTYTEHPNGLMECMRCKVCDAGARLSIKEKCTYTKNTVCGCALGDFCALPANRDCEMCSQYTICLPGSMVKILGKATQNDLVLPSSRCSGWSSLKIYGKWGSEKDARVRNVLSPAPVLP